MPRDLTIQWLPLLPGWVVALAVVAFAALVVHGARVLRRKQVPARWVLALGALRLAALTAFVLLLLRPVVSYTRQVEQAPELAVLLDASAGARLDDARAALGGEFGAALRGRFRVRYYAVGDAAVPLDADQLAGLAPDGPPVRYADSLAAVHEMLRATGSAPDCVLLVSDGNDTGTADPAATARRLGLRVDVLPPTSTTASPDVEVAIAGLQSAPRVLLGSETQFRITLRAGHPRGIGTVRVRLTEDGQEIGTAETTFDPGTAERRVTIPHRPAAAGVHRYEARIEGRDTPPFGFTATVTDGKAEVLILEDAWRWEFKYLRRVFETDPSYRFTAVLPRGGAAVVQFGSPDRRARLVGFPQSRADLEDFDLFVIGDANVRRWPAGLAAALADAVREGGKSLVVVAGPNLAQLAEVPELHSLLPVELARESGTPVGGPVDVRVSADGARSPFAVSAEGGLPPLDQIYPLRKRRPGATVLLEAAALRNAYGGVIVMAEHTAGRGRVLFVGTDTLWKWQTRADADRGGATPYSRFWQQAVRALTPAEPGRPGVRLWLRPDQTRGRAGRPIQLGAEVETTRGLARPQVRATVHTPDGRQLPLDFAPYPDDPLALRAAFTPPLPGPYRIRATLTDGGESAAEAETVIEVESRPGPSIPDHAALARLASATGGSAIDPARPETWPDPGSTPRPVVAEPRTADLWDNFSLLVLLCGLLGADWVLRLRRGYV